MFNPDKAFALHLDAQDPLSPFRERFYTPGETIYMDGNSLGLLSRDAEESLLRVVNEWKTLGIRGWLEGEIPWFYYAEKLGAMSAVLVGAQPEEVVATGTTTLNIHSLVSTFYNKEKRKNIIADELTFPTDIYALQSQVTLRNLSLDHLILAKSDDNRFLDEKKIVELMDEDTALVFLPSVLYRSGQLLNMPYLTEEAHKRGITIGFDCSHSVGVVPHFFDTWGVDFALWCSYKYLNGGPGSTAFLYVNENHFEREPMLSGWFGYVKEKQFDLRLDFEHARNAGGWQISSPAILSSAPIEGALRITLEAGIRNIREKSVKMTSYLMYLVREYLERHHFTLGTPEAPERRGGHVAVEHEEAFRISAALRARGVVTDFRPPDVIRIAPIPLYNTYEEVWRVVDHLRDIAEKKEYEKIPRERGAVT